MDGDTIFAVSTTKRPLTGGIQDLLEIGALGADCLSRAIARAVYEASRPVSHAGGRGRWQGPPAWRERFAGSTAGNDRKS